MQRVRAEQQLLPGRGVFGDVLAPGCVWTSLRFMAPFCSRDLVFRASREE